MRRFCNIIGSIFLIAFFLFSAYAYLYYEVSLTMENAFMEVGSDDIRDTGVSLSAHDPISILLLGVDSDEARGAVGRSDTIMVLTLNPHAGTAKLLSIPRDTRTEIIGRGYQDKINHAFAFGGAEMSVNTVQNFLGIPIDYVAAINMDGIEELIELVGTVTVTNPFEFSTDGFTFPEGVIHLNSAETLAYIRMRYEDPEGDFGRQRRQRDVLISLAQSLAIHAITNYQAILSATGEHLATNLPLEGLVTLATSYWQSFNNLEQLQLYGTGQMIDGIYYQIIEGEEVSAIRTTLRQHLGLE
ncbi:MAG: LCP family protein [Turicibacter sp.]|nr:LCP family protein [Turicibacter sp.]